MLKISRKTRYALRALIFLTKKNSPIVSLKEISEKEEIPFSFLEKIFAHLERGGIVKAKKGLGGGYFLSKEPKKIKLAEIFFALGEKIILTQCLSEEKYFCSREKNCLAKNFWQRFGKIIHTTLNSLTLQKLIE